MNKKIPLILVIFILVISGDALARRMKEARGFPLLVYSVEGKELKGPDIFETYKFPMRVAIIDYPVGVALWIKEKLHGGLISRHPTLVVLSPYLDCNPEVLPKLQASNWLYYLCDNELIQEIFVVFPAYTENYPAWRSSLQTTAREMREDYGYPITLLYALEALPPGKELGPVVLVIDLAFFSNSKLPSYRPQTAEDIAWQISKIMGVLRHKSVAVEALIIVESPDYPYDDQAEFIVEQLLEGFR